MTTLKVGSTGGSKEVEILKSSTTVLNSCELLNVGSRIISGTSEELKVGSILGEKPVLEVDTSKAAVLEPYEILDVGSRIISEDWTMLRIGSSTEILIKLGSGNEAVVSTSTTALVINSGTEVLVCRIGN